MRKEIIQRARTGNNKKSIQEVYLEADYWYLKGVVLNQKQVPPPVTVLNSKTNVLQICKRKSS